MKALEKQVGGSHYKTLAIQPVEFIGEMGFDYFSGNITKYLTRNKKRSEDLEKAYHYIELMPLYIRSKRLEKDIVEALLHKDFFKQFKNGRRYAQIIGYAFCGNKPKAKELLRKFINRGEYSEV